MVTPEQDETAQPFAGTKRLLALLSSLNTDEHWKAVQRDKLVALLESACGLTAALAAVEREHGMPPGLRKFAAKWPAALAELEAKIARATAVIENTPRA